MLDGAVRNDDTINGIRFDLQFGHVADQNVSTRTGVEERSLSIDIYQKGTTGPSYKVRAYLGPFIVQTENLCFTHALVQCVRHI